MSRGSAARPRAPGSGSSGTPAPAPASSRETGFASDDHLAVQALVAAGLGVSVVPGLAVAHHLPGVVVRELGAEAPVRRITAARPRHGYRGAPVTDMLECLRAAAAVG